MTNDAQNQVSAMPKKVSILVSSSGIVVDIVFIGFVIHSEPTPWDGVPSN
jgi:hypothetical protein